MLASMELLYASQALQARIMSLAVYRDISCVHAECEADREEDDRESVQDVPRGVASRQTGV
jgi:hypothetical protein